jgi:uncharacterized pyridoxamine 5'-phosphate oxidase family protein
MSDTASFALTPEISDLIAHALETGNVLLLAAVDREGKPVLSFRGSAAVFSDTQISIWVRNAEGGTIEAIEHNPNVALMYRSPTTPFIQFTGRARIADDTAERERAFSLAPERERNADPDRKGRAVIVDLDAVRGVIGFGKDGPVFVSLARAAG